jgi:hypothetical protein
VSSLSIGVNAKLDLENCIVAEPEMQAILQPISPTDVLVMGLDVYHGDTSDPEGYVFLSTTLFYSLNVNSANRQSLRCAHQEIRISTDTQLPCVHSTLGKNLW